jgi:hypothetical protein
MFLFKTREAYDKPRGPYLTGRQRPRIHSEGVIAVERGIRAAVFFVPFLSGHTVQGRESDGSYQHSGPNQVFHLRPPFYECVFMPSSLGRNPYNIDLQVRSGFSALTRALDRGDLDR